MEQLYGQLLSYDSPLDVISTSVIGAPKKTAAHSPIPSSANSQKTYVALQDQLPAATATAGNPCKDLIHIRRDRFAKSALCNNRPLEGAAASVRDRGSSDGDPHPPQLKTLRLCSVSSSAAQQPHESEEGDAEEEEKEEEEEEQGLCVTPTAREHRIPLEVLVCPPAPSKKKRKAVAKLYHGSKMRIIQRPYELSCDINAININAGLQYSTAVLSPFGFSNIELCTAAAERRPMQAFLITKPPDFHTLPECIRALFNIT